MASNKLTVSDLDFDLVKQNLKTFLQSQSEFQDYDFEGSGFSILLDLLAYNTHYLGFNANMLANEMYLDSADIRKNIVSLAKMLGYTPTSAKAPSATLNILVNNASGASITMAKGTVFTTTLKVQIQNSSSDNTTSTYTLSTGITSLDSTSRVYFLQEVEDGKFEVYFGDGVIGKSLTDGNIVILEYVVTNKTEANGASTFALSGSIETFSDVTITTVSNAQGGSEAQSKESIRYNAPLQYSAQDRAVTTSDYETKVLELYPNAQSVSAWGGEDDETPVYGVVKIAIKAASGSTLTDTTKQSIITQLKRFNVASVRPEIVDPETTSIILTSNVKYDEKATTKTADTLKSEITTAIANYNTDTLQKFDSVFRHSKITGLIDDVDTSILSNVTSLLVRKTFTPTLSSSTRYDIYFRNGIYNPHAGHKSGTGGVITTSGFKVTGDTTNVYYLDDDGNGNIRRYYFVGSVRTYVNNTQGTVNYTTGQITINSLDIASIENIRVSASTIIEVTVEPASYDIVPVRDQILDIDTANSTITVEADTFVGGAADAGVGYTVTSNY